MAFHCLAYQLLSLISTAAQNIATWFSTTTLWKPRTKIQMAISQYHTKSLPFLNLFSYITSYLQFLSPCHFTRKSFLAYQAYSKDLWCPETLRGPFTSTTYPVDVISYFYFFAHIFSSELMINTLWKIPCCLCTQKVHGFYCFLCPNKTLSLDINHFKFYWEWLSSHFRVFFPRNNNLSFSSQNTPLQ